MSVQILEGLEAKCCTAPSIRAKLAECIGERVEGQAWVKYTTHSETADGVTCVTRVYKGCVMCTNRYTNPLYKRCFSVTPMGRITNAEAVDRLFSLIDRFTLTTYIY